MNGSSLRIRLVLASSILICVAIAVAGFVLTLSFDRALDRRALDELREYLRILAAEVDTNADGTLSLGRPPTDPRFSQPYGGLYWQIEPEESEGVRLRSRSLWDATLAIPADTPKIGELQVREVHGPSDSRLLAAERRIEIGPPQKPTRLRVVAAMDRRELAGVRRAYLGALVPSVVVLGAALIVAMALFVGYAFVPFRRLQTALAEVHAGRSHQIVGSHPEEIRPLIQDLNELIARQNEALVRARAEAGDLAHGLKTTTVVLEALAEEVARNPHASLAIEISEQATIIRRTVERSLRRARAGLTAARSHQRIAAEPVALKIVTSLAKTPDGSGLRWLGSLSAETAFPGDETDLYEIIGNLVDNAMKWAKTTISVNIANQDGRFILEVEDDGPGMADGVAETVVRGKRLDETRSGTGFGLAIVKDLVGAYQGTIAFGRSPHLGGLTVCVDIPL